MWYERGKENQKLFSYICQPAFFFPARVLGDPRACCGVDGDFIPFFPPKLYLTGAEQSINITF